MNRKIFNSVTLLVCRRPARLIDKTLCRWCVGKLTEFSRKIRRWNKHSISYRDVVVVIAATTYCALHLAVRSLCGFGIQAKQTSAKNQRWVGKIKMKIKGNVFFFFSKVKLWIDRRKTDVVRLGTQSKSVQENLQFSSSFRSKTANGKTAVAVNVLGGAP